MAEIKYDIKRGASIYRAIYGSRLQRWISLGKIKAGEVLVWRDGLSGWRRPEELEELVPFFEQWKESQVREVKKKEMKEGRKGKPFPQQKIKNILIIDDEKDLCSLLSDLLSRRRYNVAIANTKREAIASLKRATPDLVFLDLKLPDGDGMKVLSEINQMNPRTIVNIISAYGSEERREEAKKKGVYSFIDKPFAEKEVLRSIKQFADRK